MAHMHGFEDWLAVEVPAAYAGMNTKGKTVLNTLRLNTEQWKAVAHYLRQAWLAAESSDEGERK